MRSRESQLNKRRHRRRHKGYPIGRALQLAANVGCNKIVRNHVPPLLTLRLPIIQRC
jgi:hypothetical protein